MKHRTLFLMVVAMATHSAVGAQCFPSVIVQNGVAVNLRPVDTNGDGTTNASLAVLHVNDLIVRANNPCSNEPLEFGLSRSGTTTQFPPVQTLTFGCDELGNQGVEVWVRDGDGTVRATETYVQIQDNGNYCEDVPPQWSVNCANDQCMLRLP